MNYVKRYWRPGFTTAIVVAVMASPYSSPASAQERIDWLRQHTLPIRGTSQIDDDYADLEPLGALLENIRIVQLAELTHGDGAGSETRARLVRFLYERLGFDVLVWEAGLAECDQINARLSGDAPLHDVPANALWWFWASSSQIMPIFEYARETWKTQRPLRMAGFDLQFTGGERGLIQRVRDLRGWFTAAGQPLPDHVLEMLDRAESRLLQSGGAGEAVRDTLLAYTADVVALYERHEAALRAAHGPEEAARMERILHNMVEYRAMLADRDRSYAGGPEATEAFIDSYNRRERVNANNLIWLAEERYKGAKVIVWSHNVHAAYTRMTPGHDSLVAANTAHSLESTGRLLKMHFGDAVYTVGSIAYEGEWGLPGDRSVAILRPEHGGLEHLLHGLGHELAILDLRPARTPHHWLMYPSRGSLSAQVPHTYPVIWPEVFDGVLFVNRMTPAQAVR